MSLSGAQLPEKHPLDQSESRTLVLDNGLKVLMVSDPDLNLSSASMAIDVGSFKDPEDALGLAHFLEHMLFLGTEKYPNEGEYKEYLTQNGGYSNAYTSRDHTNYHFQVFPEAFEGALDRFAQFFIAPLFIEEFTQREKNAVDSEFELYLEDDTWRNQRIFALFSRKGHPSSQFLVGNNATLEHVTREQVIDFYNEYYSANQMALSLVSTHPLDQMETWVREKFSAIETDGRDALRYPSDFLEKTDAVRMVRIKAVEDRKILNVYFNTPANRHDWDAKSSDIISATLGYEGKGSLLSSLKDENLAIALGSSVWDATVDYTVTAISVDLTEAGHANPGRVLELVLDYIEMLRQSPYPDYIYDQESTLAKLREIYTDKGEGADRATDLANRALQFPLEYAEDLPTTFLRQDPDFYYQLLDAMRPENMLVLFAAKDMETDEQEDIYGVEYSYTEERGELFERLSNPQINSNQTLPNPNPFIPETVELLNERPVLLVDEPGLTLYYGQDHEFQRPKVAAQFKVRLPDTEQDVGKAVLFELYEAAVNEYVNEIGYDALMAELVYMVRADAEGVSVAAFGYTESANKLLPYLTSALKGFSIEEARFEAIKQRMIRGWNNAEFDAAARYIRYFTSSATYRDYFLPGAKADAAESVSLADIYAFRDQLFENGNVEALVYGNVSAPEAESMARQFQESLSLQPVDSVYANKVLAQDPGNSLVFKDVVPTNNSAYRRDYIAGMATPQNRVAAAVLGNLINAPYYSEMRTRQQLGYVVWSFTFNIEDMMRIGFIIQSGDYDPVELDGRSDALIATFPGLLREMPEEAFLQAKSAVRSEIEKKDKTIMEKSARFFRLAYDHGANWNRRQESLDALEALTMEDVVAFLEAAIDPETSQSQLILLFARQEEELAGETEAVDDLDTWKAKQEYRDVSNL
ncbi:MAG: insulinase family protein [Puniceicoccaceae bacterium]